MRLMPCSSFISLRLALLSLTPSPLPSSRSNRSLRSFPHSSWIASTKFTSDGSSIVTEGKEIPLEDLPPFDEDKIKTLPMVWHNPLVRLSPFTFPLAERES